MKKMLIILAALLLTAGIAGAAPAKPQIEGKTVEYRAGDTLLKGYLATDTALKGKRPGVLVVHEWWGLNDYARKRARMLAELGYVALAVDMFGDGKQARHPDEAGAFAGAVMKNFDTGKARFNAALELLKQQPDVDPTRIAAIGYCFGGGVVLNMARQGADLKGVASFHGSLAAVQPAEKGAVKAKILVLTGADDKMVPPGQVAAFKEEMQEAGADFRVISYPGAKHSFTNPDADKYAKEFNLPIAYNKKADTASWDELKKFFKEIFKVPAAPTGAVIK
ncbi:MAG: prolyl oligopeptidase family serine peptidase [Geobacter sp.]|nr:prolyl oligopeptidase family serine peptidase [Geobacter sp.]